MDSLVALSYAKCRELLGGGIVGRVGFCTPRGPRIFPVNYSVIRESVVFRTTDDGEVANHEWGAPMVFEVDHVDYSDHRGWSVVATGIGVRVEDPVELATIMRKWDPSPWAGGSREFYVRLVWEELTGRRLGTG